MALKNLRSFLQFNSTDFFAKKKLCYLNSKELFDEKGIKVTLLILEDDTEYNSLNDNLGEQIYVKVTNKKINDFEDFQPLQTLCKIINITKATVYGDYQNQLSLTGEVIKIETGGKN
ncbi:hypothetical protein [Streptococcus ferus]|uniref:hypothetical protein n=1 Tax=Streptococcus ferus TaxID=1345 RepID=UPI0035A0CB9A